jgi:hypothetical protein
MFSLNQGIEGNGTKRYACIEWMEKALLMKL